MISKGSGGHFSFQNGLVKSNRFLVWFGQLYILMYILIALMNYELHITDWLSMHIFDCFYKIFLHMRFGESNPTFLFSAFIFMVDLFEYSVSTSNF